MDFWAAVVLIIAVGVISEMYQARLKASSLSRKQSELAEGLAERMRRIEERMANLETLVLEHEKGRKFDALTRER